MHRASLALALACAAAVTGWALGSAPPAYAAVPGSSGARTALLFMPSPSRPTEGKTFIERIGSIRGLTAFGFVSAIQGSHTPEQVLLDISSGARATTSLYDRDLPSGIALAADGRGATIRGWPQVRSRAATPPADVEPGTLAQSVRDAGGRIAYVGGRRGPNREAIVAADHEGRVERVSLGSRAGVGQRAIAAWRGADLLVVRLPAGRLGRAAIETVLTARRAADLVIVLQGPSDLRRSLLAAGTAGLAGGQDLRSDSTRTDGLVVTTDLAPTLLDQLNVPVPDHVAGQPIEARGDRSVADLSELRERLGEIGNHRWSIVTGALALSALLIAAASRGRWRTVGRGALLAALWMPSVMLVTGAIAPSGIVELGILGVASAALAFATDALLPWPRAIALPAAVTVGAHVLDLVLGSQLIVRSRLGPNPLIGARFYGIGNELEITLAVATLLGLGAALVGAGARVTAWTIAIGGGLVAFLLSWGRLGADVGAALTLGLGVAAAAVYAGGRGTWRTRAAVVLGAPALALGLLAALDLVTGGDAHFTRSVLRAGGLQELAQVVQRRLELSYSSLGRGLVGPLVIVAIAALVTGFRLRKRLLAPLDRLLELRAGFFGAVVAVIGGALTNDSGPIIFLIGTTYLALAVGYFQSMPNRRTYPAGPTTRGCSR